MNQQSYRYDVAISFLAQDELLATELNDLLQDRLKVFLYSKQQGEIAGTDGEETFNRVFGEESRIVVVLYRSGWGQTAWTRIEETAIRNRAYDHGYDFVVFIPLDEPPTAPKWLPKAQLWVGLKRWGTTGAASVIEARVQQRGGEACEETVQKRAARLERSRNFAQRRERFLNSEESVQAADREFDTLEAELQRLIADIKTSASSITFNFKRAQRQVVILGLGLGLLVSWCFRYVNSLRDSELVLSLWDGHPPFPGVKLFNQPKILSTLKFHFDLTPSETYVWYQPTSNARQYSTKDLASFILKNFMDEGLKRSVRT